MTTIDVINPATETICGHYPIMNKDEVTHILHESNLTQQSWASTSFNLRKQCLSNLAKTLANHIDRCAHLITEEMGKPISQATAEVTKCIRLCEYYAQHAEAFLQPEFIQTECYKSYRSFLPLGIIFAIMPWNFPFWQVMRFAIPNLMAGNAGILKHAPNATGSALLIEQLFLEAGFPQNLFRSLVIDIDLVPYIIHHPYIAGVTLTGSNRAGQSVAQEAGAALKKVVLELGGSDAYVVLEDADIKRAAEQCVKSRLANAGQVCIAAKRIIVADSIKTDFLSHVLEIANSYAMGDPSDPKTLLGPMARNDLRLKIQDQVERSIAAGAHCVLGGSIPDRIGFYYPPTILTEVAADSPAFHEEFFGPVICITSAKNEDEAMMLANKTKFGLAGAIFTRNLTHGEHLAQNIMRVGTCAVNALVESDPRLPFGGIKQSGFGRELSVEGMREFVNIKTIKISQ